MLRNKNRVLAGKKTCSVHPCNPCRALCTLRIGFWIRGNQWLGQLWFVTCDRIPRSCFGIDGFFWAKLLHPMVGWIHECSVGRRSFCIFSILWPVLSHLRIFPEIVVSSMSVAWKKWRILYEKKLRIHQLLQLLARRNLWQIPGPKSHSCGSWTSTLAPMLQVSQVFGLGTFVGWIWGRRQPSSVILPSSQVEHQIFLTYVDHVRDFFASWFSKETHLKISSFSREQDHIVS